MQILPITLAAAGARAGLDAGAAVIDQAGSFARRLANTGRNGHSSGSQQPANQPSALLAQASDQSVGGGAVSVSGLQQQLSTLLGTVHQQFTSLLEQSGITADPPVKLQFDAATGAFVVPADHPHRTEIDALLSENPELTSQFRRILALQSLLQAAESQPGATTQPGAASQPADGAAPGTSSGQGILSLRLDRHEARVELA